MDNKTKTIATTIIIVIVLVAAFLFITYQGQDDTRKFLGAWKTEVDTVEIIYTFSDDISGKDVVVYGFDENGTLVYNTGGKYEIKGGRLCITPSPGSGSSPIYYDYNFSNNSNTLTLSYNDSFTIILDKMESFNLTDYLKLQEPREGVYFTPMWWRYDSPYAKFDFRLSYMTQPSWARLTPEDLDELNVTVQYNGVDYPYTLEYNYSAGVEQYELQADIGESASGEVVFTISYVYGEFSGTEEKTLYI